VGKQRSGRALLWIIPLGFCLLPGAGCIVIQSVLDSTPTRSGQLDLSGTSPNCVHDEEHLLVASRDGDLAEVEELLADGADVHQKDANGQTPLYCAAFNGHDEVVVALIVAGAEIDHGNASGETALHWASRHGDRAIVNILLGAGADPDVGTNRSHTPLLWAALEGETDIVDTLLSAGADPNIPGETNSIEVAAYLSPPGGARETTSTSFDARMPSCFSFTEPEAEVTPLDVAVATQGTEIVAALLAAGATPEGAVFDCTPLHVASWVCDADLVALLLAAGAPGEIDRLETPTPMEIAEDHDCAAVVELLSTQRAAAGS